MFVAALAASRQNAVVESWLVSAAASVRSQLEAALDRPIEDPSAWRIELLARPNVAGLATIGIWRVGGAEWSAVVKVLAHADSGAVQWASHPHPDHPYYWKREALAYDSRLLHGLQGGIRAPACYGVTGGADGSVAVWMEDVARSGDPAGRWPCERYAEAARQLGVMQAELADSDLLKERWLSRGYLRMYVERRSAGAFPDAEAWRHPEVRAALGSGQADAYHRLWSDCRPALQEIETLPQTLCHLDLHPHNMFGVDTGGASDTVLIDWAFSGVGGIGEDVATLLIDAVADFHVPPERLPGLFDVLADGYAAGLAEGGLRLGAVDVRRAVALGAIARYFWLPSALVRALAEERPTINGRPASEATPYWAAAAKLLLELADLIR